MTVRPSRAGRLVRAVAAALLGLTPLAGAAAAAPGPAATASPLVVGVAAVSPQVARPTTDVAVSVTVRNPGSTALTGITATARLGSRRFEERGEVGTWLANAAQPSGTALAEAVSPPVDLAPGASTTVTVTVPKTAWHLPRPFAAVPVDVTVAGGASAGSTRTVVPWVAATPQFVPLELAWAAPLTAPADPRLFTSRGADTLAAWQDAIGPGSTVQARLAAAGSTPVTWFVDPTLIEAERFVAGANAQVSGTNPEPTDPAVAARAGTARSLVGALTTALRSVPATQSVWSLPPGDPDTAALLPHIGALGGLAPRLYPPGPTALDTALGLTAPRATAWPADGRWDDAREAAWSRATGGYPLTGALVSSSTIAAGSGFTAQAVNRSARGAGLVAYDEGLSDLAGGTTSAVARLGTAQVVQGFLAESLVLLGEREGTTRGTVVALPRTSPVSPATLRALWSATSSAPWLRTTTLPALAAQLPTAPVATTTMPAQPLEPASPITTDAVTRAASDQAALAGIAVILPADRASYPAVWGAADAQLLGARWRASTAGWITLRDAVSKAVTTTSGAVHVAPATVNFLADGGTVGIYVSNDLPYPVSGVRLHLEPGNVKLRVDEQPAPITIQARSKRKVTVPVTALGSGEVPVVARLTTPEGTPLGAAQTVTMNVRPPAEWVLYVIGGAIALVLVAGLVRTLTRKPTRAVRDDLPAPEDLARPADPSPRGER